MGKKKSELLTVIVPCLNEEHTVSRVVETIVRVGEGFPLEVETLLIDDGSTDGTRRVLADLCERHEACRMVVNERNLGNGRSILNAYEGLDPDSWATVVPGDDEVVFESLTAYIEQRERYDVMLGYLQNPIIRTNSRRLASFMFTKTVSALYGFHFRYLNGLKMYRVSAFRGIEVVSSGHAFNAELLAKAVLRNPALRIGELPFMARGRASGDTKAFRPG